MVGVFCKGRFSGFLWFALSLPRRNVITEKAGIQRLSLINTVVSS